MNINVSIDYREKALIDILNNDNFIFKCSNLPVGDICYTNDNEEIILIIERKSADDLASSIKDGRYKEQKSRLFPLFDNNRHFIVYIVECLTNYKNKKQTHGIPYSTLISALINTMVRDGCSVLISSSVDETATFIKSIHKCITTHGHVTPVSHVTEMKMKGDLNTPKSCYISQLACVPSISIKIATSIAKIYPNMTELVNELVENDVKNISNIVINDGDDSDNNIKKRGRKIGEKVSKKLYDYLLFE